jgi:uncharacterized protein (TIGR02646 family)
MVQIKKNLTDVPASLQLPFPVFFPDIIPSPPVTTHKRRMEIIGYGSYIDKQIYSDRYKQKDVKKALKDIYNSKCAFCEQRVEQSHVEHYRPKSVYYWLTYSWDNLLLACSTCNQYKGDFFDLRGNTGVVNFTNNEANILAIHNSSNNYDVVELPKMINPEIHQPLGNLQFKRNGVIESNNENFQYTITKCKIDRIELNDQRRELLDKFASDIRLVLAKNKNSRDQKTGIETIVSVFIEDVKNPKSTFLAFKNFAIVSDWLSDIIKEEKGK